MTLSFLFATVYWGPSSIAAVKFLDWFCHSCSSRSPVLVTLESLEVPIVEIAINLPKAANGDTSGSLYRSSLIRHAGGLCLCIVSFPSHHRPLDSFLEDSNLSGLNHGR